MEIKMVEQYGETDLDVEPVCKRIAEAIDIDGENEIELNLSECLIGYDSTCIIIDKVIQQMTNNTGKKTLTIICEYKFPLDIVAPLLFCGSKFVDDNTSTRKDSKIIQSKLKDSLAIYNIAINLLIDRQQHFYV